MAEPPDFRVADTGVAWIRTRLAWGRTVLTLSVVAVLAARFGVRHGLLGGVYAAVAVAGWAVAGLWVMRRLRQLSGRSRPVSAATPRVLMAAALIAPAYAILGLLMLLTL
ncbi:DUF202 domain-containing protein [Asanoa sp. WMMD1127]|uniref:DUF202 domain-containing protein n=1 Tax=Asanoa sp. WMMD1127 TaxID=3016107 RepID=UPI002416F395|nr:DUF202 domain-containing protein [Asanoa sp. WMMD1127]MDG4823431.1 DUF202 domain-containing protein [Asanoa sp. WMMD1127]